MISDKELFLVLIHAALSNPEYENMDYISICIHVKENMMPAVKRALSEYD